MAAARAVILRKLREVCHLKTVKNVTFRFDPFSPNVRSCRDILSILGSNNVRSTNEKCRVKTKVQSDRSEPLFDVEFDDGSKVLFKTENLTTVELMTLFNKVIACKVEQVAQGEGKKI